MQNEVFYIITENIHNEETQKAQAREDRGKERTLSLYYTADIVINQSWSLIGEVSL